MQELEDDINISVINPQEAQWALRVRGNQTQQTEINTALAYQGGEEMCNGNTNQKQSNNPRSNQNFQRLRQGRNLISFKDIS